MFGVEGMKAAIENSSKSKIDIFDEIIKNVENFRKDYPQQDDLTLIEISMI